MEISELKRKLDVVSVQFSAAVSPPPTPRNESRERSSSFKDHNIIQELEAALDEKNKLIEVLRAGKTALSQQVEELSNEVKVERMSRTSSQDLNRDKGAEIEALMAQIGKMKSTILAQEEKIRGMDKKLVEAEAGASDLAQWQELVENQMEQINKFTGIGGKSYI